MHVSSCGGNFLLFFWASLYMEVGTFNDCFNGKQFQDNLFMYRIIHKNMNSILTLFIFTIK